MASQLAIYDRLRESDEAVAKVLRLPAVSQIARAEGRLRELLLASWNRHAWKAAEAAGRAAHRSGSVKGAVGRVKDEMAKWAKEVTPKLQEELARIFVLAREVGWKKATGQTRATLTYDTPNLTEIKKALPRPGFRASPSFDLVDSAAVGALQGQQVFWVGEHYSKNLSGAIAKTTRESMLEAGRDRVAAGKLVERSVRTELGRVVTPGGFVGTPAQYFEGLAANAATTARSFGQLSSFMRAGITRYTISNPQDRRTCEVCQHMDGKTFSVQQGADTMGGVLAADSPDGVKSAQPWMTQSQLTEVSPNPGEGSRADSAALSKAGFNLPPFHFRCRCAVDVDEGADYAAPVSPSMPPAPPAKIPVPVPKLPVTSIPRPVPKPKPSKYPEHSKAVHPTRGRYDPEAMKKAMTPVVEGKELTATQQAVIRKELNELLEEYGLHNRDLFLFDSDVMRIVAYGPETAGGTHFATSGKIYMRADNAKHGGKFFTLGPGRAKLGAKNRINGARTFLHEAIHGTNPKRVLAAREGVGSAMVEVSTEAATRQIMVEKFGAVWGELRGYARPMRATEQVIGEAFDAVKGPAVKTLAPLESQQIMGKAGIRLMQRKAAIKTSKEYAQAFVEDMEWPDRFFEGMTSAKKSSSLKKLRTELANRLEKLFGASK